MSINKNALIRYQTLDKCFANSYKKQTIETLLASCNDAIYDYNQGEGIKRRQLFEDIKFMESSQGWNIVLERIKEGRKVYYRYEDQSYSINNQPMNEWEAEKIKAALLVLSRFKGMPQFEWVNELILKLQSAFRLEEMPTEIISFDSNEYLKNIDMIGDLFQAIVYQKVLRLEYQTFKDEGSKTFEFHPYYLKQYNNRWFLIGLYPRFENLTNFALDRIVQFSTLDIAYVPTTIDFDDYFDDFIGITKPKSPLEKVILKAPLFLKPYLTTKPLHGSQKRIDEDEHYFIFSIEIAINFELENLILSYGETLEIEEPLPFREKIKARLIKNLTNYD